MRSVLCLFIGMIGVVAAGAVSASQLTYAPVNPTFFGGNPLNGNYLLGVAEQQGFGKAGSSTSPDLSGLNDALKNLNISSPVIIVPSTPTTSTATIPTSP
jgi:curli production assembly/transport component CsgF